jgi:uncharacterized coiled-coil protein SlyX
MSEKKVINRNVAFALGLLCIVLAAGLVAVLALGNGSNSADAQTISDLQNQVASKNAAIASLNTQIASLQASLNNQNSNNAADSSAQITQLKSQLQYCYSVLYLNESAFLINAQSFTQDANASSVIYENALEFAGYIQVTVSASANSTYVQAAYSYGGVVYNQDVTVGTSGEAYIPVLPSIVNIAIGNTNSTDTNSGTVTVTYHY